MSTKSHVLPVTPEQLVSILGVIYVHKKTSDGGDLYLTRFGLRFAHLLEVENWFEKEWFTKHRERLEGTSAVFRVPTKPVNGQVLDLVVKNCRVGEDVPLDTHTLIEFINAEFNSPWEEFSLVMEMREGKYGPSDIRILTQEPLAIYVPPDIMQVWQSGRSKSKMNRIRARHPGIDLDILKQYKLLYGWIHGRNILEAFTDIGIPRKDLLRLVEPINTKVMQDLEVKGYAVADMKPAHIIISETDMVAVDNIGGEDSETRRINQMSFLRGLIEFGNYSVIDYELLLRTKPHEEVVQRSRRSHYLDDQRDRHIATELPSHLHSQEIFGVPYVTGHVESTGGQLWVVGRNGRLFDYFLPERWRKTHSWRLSTSNEVFYTVTKDMIHLVWKTSRVGEAPVLPTYGILGERIREHGYNSPFEEFAIANDLSSNGIPTVYVRAIYMTGSAKLEQSTDPNRYESHRELLDSQGSPILREDRNYITLRGYYNGSDTWVAQQHGNLCKPIDLSQAVLKGIITHEESARLFDRLLSQMKEVGYDGSLLQANDLLLTTNPEGTVHNDEYGHPEVRICNFELIRKN